jgi:uncharacterized protein YdeI (YjbR/CyaY-like superfamily)
MAMLSKRRWPEESEQLRAMLREFPLTEERKWGKPCFLFEGKNVALIQEFNESIALMFFKGALLKDGKKLLEKPGENTQAARVLRFMGLDEIVARRTVVKGYVAEAIELEKAGLKVKLKANSAYSLPEELERKFDEIKGLKEAFYSLTPGRQRAYVLQISAAKQSATRAARIEKYAPQILAGLGLMDRAWDRSQSGTH